MKNTPIKAGDFVWDVINHRQYKVDDVQGEYVYHNMGCTLDFNLVILAAAPVPIPAIVALIAGGKALPSHRPHVHADVGSAVTEAQRLAKKHPGSEFGTFVLKNLSIAAEPVVSTRAA
jgi:hypothetical protein